MSKLRCMSEVKMIYIWIRQKMTVVKDLNQILKSEFNNDVYRGLVINTQ